MAATTDYSTEYYNTSGRVIVPNMPRIPESGIVYAHFSASIGTAQLGDVNDRTYLCPVPHRCRYTLLAFDASDMDTGGPTLTGTIVARNPDDDVETTMVTAFSPSAAIADAVYKIDLSFAKNTATYYDLVFKVTAAATTPAAGTITGLILGGRDLR